MASNYSRVIGMQARSAKGELLGTLTDVYTEGSRTICVIDDTYEVTCTRMEELHDFINGPAASFVRIY